TATKTNTKALVIFFHGLNGRPSVWNDHIHELEKLSKDHPEFAVDLFAPHLPKGGHCTLEDPEVEILFKDIREWVEKNPAKPIVMFGQSNGCRFALRLETLLREHAPQSPVQLFLTGPVLFGTSLIQRCTNIASPTLLNRLSFGLITPTACQELGLGSD